MSRDARWGPLFGADTLRDDLLPNYKFHLVSTLDFLKISCWKILSTVAIHMTWALVRLIHSMNLPQNLIFTRILKMYRDGSHLASLSAEMIQGQCWFSEMYLAGGSGCAWHSDPTQSTQGQQPVGGQGVCGQWVIPELVVSSVDPWSNWMCSVETMATWGYSIS